MTHSCCMLYLALHTDSHLDICRVVTQAGRGHLLVTDCQHCNTGYTHVDHPIRQGAFAPFNTAEVHISGFDCCLDNCTVCYAVTTNQSVLAVTGGLAFENMQSCFTNTSASRGHFL